MALYGYYKDKVAPLHVMKAYRRSKGTTPLILNLLTTSRSGFVARSSRFAPGGIPPPTTERDAGWVPQSVQTVWSQIRFLPLLRIEPRFTGR